MADWGSASSSDWNSYRQNDPLFGGGSSGRSSLPDMYTYDQRGSSGWGMDYDPTLGRSSGGYDPYSNYSSSLINYNIDKYIQENHPELFQFDSGTLNNGGGFGGNVSTNPTFGQFAKDPTVFSEIEAAASKYGVPANLLKVMIARESSGDWQANSHATFLESRGERIVGYTGIMESTAKSWGYNFDDLVGNRALQIDAMANGLSRLYQQVGGQHGWDGVIATYYSGDPTGLTTPADSYQYGTTQQYVASVKTWWSQEDAWTQANGGELYREGSTGMASPTSRDWQPVNKWDSYVAEASAKYGVPANLVKSIIRLESGGDPQAQHPASGATGLMQIMPGIWNNGNSQQLFDPAYNIDLGTKILKTNYDQYGSWEMAAKAYLGLVGSDANGTDSTMYWNTVSRYWNELDAGVSGVFGGEEGDRGPVTTISAIWGDMPGVTITQRNGEVNGWTTGEGASYYDYSTGVLGYPNAHPGNDYGMNYGSRIFSPVGGTVVIVGSGYYNDERQMGQPQTGELRIRLDNGHELILGHMAGIHVTVGDRINPGQYVGLSGHAGTGPHLHLEYRVPDPAMSSGWRSIDPEEALRGTFTSTLSGNMTGAGIDRPMTFQELMKAGASGGTIYGGATIGSANTWNSWLQKAMKGEIPNTREESLKQTQSTGNSAYGRLGGTRTRGLS